MGDNRFSFQSQVQRFPGFGGWYFVCLPKEMSQEIMQKYGYTKRGWGSFPVKATLGSTVWITSIFPHDKSYFLALKAEVRKKESIAEGNSVILHLEIKDDIFC